MSRYEEMSSWMDNEADARAADAMPSQVLQDSESRKRWNEWHMIGDAMRSSSLGRTSMVADRVADRLASEPIHLPTAKARDSRRDILRRSRVAYVAAVAAAVAFVTVVAVAPYTQEGGLTGLIAATGLIDRSATGSSSEPALAQVLPEDPRLRDLLEAHGSMSIRPVSFEAR
mgnify:CR=1 FL=1